jgi:hypothetical protein
LKNDHGYVFEQRLLVSIFNGEKVPEVQYSTLKNEPRANFQPGSKYFVTPVPLLDGTRVTVYQFSFSGTDQNGENAVFVCTMYVPKITQERE